MKRFTTFLIAVLALLAGHVWAQGLPDPTRPSTYVDRSVLTEQRSEGMPGWDLRAIKTGNDSRIAIINGQLVRVGEEINSARVVEINSDSVVIEHRRSQIVLKVLAGNVKSTHAGFPGDPY